MTGAPGPFLSLEQLSALRRAATRDGLRLSWACGCFDLPRPGHVACLRHARILGHRLVVGLLPDDTARGLLGPGRPFLGFMEQAEVMSAFACVDWLALCAAGDPVPCLRALAPDYWVVCEAEGFLPPPAEALSALEAGGGTIHHYPS